MPLSFDEFVQTMRAFQESRVLLTAVELGVFTAVGEGAAAAAVAAALQTDPRATEMLLNALVALGALDKRGGVYYNTPETARYLAAGSPDYAGAGLMHTVNLWRTWSTLTECVRKGGPVVEPGVEGRDPQWTQSFIAAMHHNAAGAARELAAAVGVDGVRRVLDIGGGSGAYSIELARANPELRAEVLDLEPVAEIARQHIAAAGLSDRVTTRVGDLRRDPFGEGYDLILLSAICHMLSPAENQDLLARCFLATGPGGRIVIRDFLLEPDRTAPRQAALFALNMLVATRGGSTYTFQEYADWLASAGYCGVSRLDAAGGLIVARRSGG